MNVLIIADEEDDPRVRFFAEHISMLEGDVYFYITSEVWDSENKRFKKIEGGTTLKDVSFLFSLRHARDYFKDQNLYDGLKITQKFVYSGNGSRETRVLPEEKLLHRNITRERPLEDKELNELISFSISGQLSSLLINKEKEKEIAETYKVLTPDNLFHNLKRGLSNFQGGRVLAIFLPETFGSVWGEDEEQKAQFFANFKEFVFPDTEVKFVSPPDFTCSFSAQLRAAGLEASDFIPFKKESSLDDFNPDLVVINAELCTGEEPYQYYQTYAGLDMMRDLRSKGCRCPMVYGSVSKKEEIQKRDHIGLLHTPGHYYLNLQEPEALPELKGLTQILWNDIYHSVLDPAGRYHELFHSVFQPRWRAKVDVKVVLEEIFETLRVSFPNEYNRNFDALLHLKERIQENFGDNNTSKLSDRILESIKNQIEDILGFSGLAEDELDLSKKGDWQILYVEDDEEYGTYLKNKLKYDYDLKCKLVKNKQEAIEVLNQDDKNEITVLICDWRLFKPGTKDWQNTQGLEILMEVASDQVSFPGLVSFFLLTDKRGGIVRMAQRGSLGYPVNWYSKKDISDELGFNAFCQKVIEEGNRIFQSIGQQITSVLWTKGITRRKKKDSKKEEKSEPPYPLQDVYNIYHKLGSYKTLEKELNQITEKYVEEALALKDKRQRAPDFSRKINLLDFGIEEGLRFRVQIKESQGRDEKVKAFWDKLLGRRIALSLGLHGWLDEEIFTILNSQEYLGEDDRQPTDNQIGNLFYHLFLRKNLKGEGGREMLTEEHNFLRDTYKVLFKKFETQMTSPIFEFHDLCNQLGHSIYYQAENGRVKAPEIARQLKEKGYHFLKKSGADIQDFLSFLEKKKSVKRQYHFGLNKEELEKYRKKVFAIREKTKSIYFKNLEEEFLDQVETLIEILE